MHRPAKDRSPFHLEAEHAVFITRDGISCSVAARDGSNQPSVAKALAVRVRPDQCTLEVIVDAERAPQVLRDLRADSPLACVFSEPGSHRTIQVKGEGAATEPASADDVRLVTTRVDAIIDHLVRHGYRREALRAYFGFTPAALTKIVFVAAAAFAQTPGPGAGARLGA